MELSKEIRQNNCFYLSIKWRILYITPVKTKQMTFILGRLSGLPTIHAFRSQTTREKHEFTYFIFIVYSISQRCDEA